MNIRFRMCSLERKKNPLTQLTPAISRILVVNGSKKCLNTLKPKGTVPHDLLLTSILQNSFVAQSFYHLKYKTPCQEIWLETATSSPEYPSNQLTYLLNFKNSSFLSHLTLSWRSANFKDNIAQSTGAVEYTDCFSAEG